MWLHWNVNISLCCNFDCSVIACIHVTNYAHTGIVS
jgi:hypothetical protein